jgi:DNA-binding beta-propeller fold protein YncE
MRSGCHILVSGRWDNTVAVVDLERALDPANDATSNAIVNRVRVTPDIDADGDGVTDTPASGQPVSIAIPRSGRFAYVVNHSGRATPAAAAAFQHGHPGIVTVLDLVAALDPANNGTTAAMAGLIATGMAGPVGVAMTPDDNYVLVTSAEAAEREDGGCEVTVIDAGTRSVVGRIPLAVRSSGSAAPEPSPHAAPHPSYGNYPDPNGIAVSPLGPGYAFTGNGGTDDVSVIDLKRALTGDPRAEVARVPVEAGPFGLAVSPDGRRLAVASRENAKTGVEGRTISIIDIERAAAGRADAEVVRVPVGSDDPNVGARPFAVAFTRDGKQIVVTCFRSNAVSLVDMEKALGGRPAEVARLALDAPGGGPSRPRGIAMTPDGRYAVITGGAKTGPGSSVLFIVDVQKMVPAARVTGVGNESYLLDILSGARV